MILRFGVIFAREGGALPEMARPFLFGAGGRLGRGTQWISWVALADAIRVIQLCIRDAGLKGAVNVVAPEPVRNAEFAKMMGRVLHRPAILPAPAFALRLALGEMADALLLASQRAIPKHLAQSGYAFKFGELGMTLRAMLDGGGETSS